MSFRFCVVHAFSSERKKSKWLAAKKISSIRRCNSAYGCFWCNTQCKQNFTTCMYTKPVGVTEAVVFLVNTNKLRHQEDIRADDVRSWCHEGKPIWFCRIEHMWSGECAELRVNYRYDDGADGTFKLIHIYYHHKGTPGFCKTIFYVNGIVFGLLIKGTMQWSKPFKFCYDFTGYKIEYSVCSFEYFSIDIYFFVLIYISSEYFVLNYLCYVFKS